MVLTYQQWIFFALEHVPVSDSGSDIDPRLLRLETKWIVTLQATKSLGLN